MRKRGILCFVVLFLLSGCSKRNTADKEFTNTYNSFVESIMDNKGTISSDIPFSYTMKVEKQSNHTYYYDVTIDQTRIAMYNIQMMIVDKNAGGDYPFIGLLPDEDVYAMIPNQENKDKNFVKGITLGGVSSSPAFELQVMVRWKDYAQVNTSTIFFTLTYDEQAQPADDTAPADDTVVE